MPDAIKLLTEDHRKVEKLFGEYERNQSADVVQQVCQELTIHAEIEEQVLYPVLAEDVSGGEKLEREAHQEHQEVKDAIARIERAGYDGTDVAEHMRVIMQGVRHHVSEEESEIFPKLQKELGEEQLTALGEELQALKQELMGSMTGAGRQDLIDLTRDELYQKAAEQGIEGRSDMKKDELIEALSKSNKS